MILLTQSNIDQKDIWKLAFHRHEITREQIWDFTIFYFKLWHQLRIWNWVQILLSIKNILLMIIFWIIVQVFCAYFIVFKILHASHFSKSYLYSSLSYGYGHYPFELLRILFSCYIWKVSIQKHGGNIGP